MPTDAELIRYRDKKRNNLQQIKIKKLEEYTANLEIKIERLEKELVATIKQLSVPVESEEFVTMVVAEVRAQEIYKALGTMAKLEIVKIPEWMGYYIEISDKQYRELVGDNDTE